MPGLVFNFPSAILIIGIYTSILMSFLLFTRPSRQHAANRTLGLISLGMGYVILQALFLFSDKEQWGRPMVRLLPAVMFMYGPGIYLYVQTFISKRYPFRPIQLLHLTPSLAILIVGIFLLDLPSGHETPLIEQLRQRPPGWVEKFIGLSIILQVGSYLFLSIRLIVRYRNFVRESASFSDELHFRWLVSTVGILLIPLVSGILALAIVGPIRDFPYPALGASIMLILIHLLYVLRPGIFSGISDELKISEPSDIDPPKYESSNLDEVQKARYYHQLLTYMEQRQPYLRQDLTRDQLAEGVKINSKYLSQIINEMGGMNFMDFVNGYRIKFAQQKLLNPAYSHFTVVAIAQEAGFRSRSAFYAAFKKITGMTPSTYRETQINS